MIKEGDRVRNCWGDWGKIIAIESDDVYILMDNPEASDGNEGVDICLLSDIYDELDAQEVYERNVQDYMDYKSSYEEEAAYRNE